MTSPATVSRVLIVEDQLVVAMLLEAEMVAAGYQVIGPFGTVMDALAHLENEQPDVALLDVRLNGEDVFPVADFLRKLRVPFVFVTAQTRDMLPPRYRDTPRVPKPFHPDQVLALVADAIGV